MTILTILIQLLPFFCMAFGIIAIFSPKQIPVTNKLKWPRAGGFAFYTLLGLIILGLQPNHPRNFYKKSDVRFTESITNDIASSEGRIDTKILPQITATMQPIMH